ncbi:MAG: flagellar biosynthesis protein FlhB [Pseudomonadota bacterium]
MAEENKDQERTEEATPKKREKAREEGRVAKSRELASVAVLGASLLYFYFGASGLITRITDMMKAHFIRAGSMTLTIDSIQPFAVDMVFQTFVILAPFLVMIIVASLAANLLQVGFTFSAKSIAPKFSKIDPLKGFKRMFSLQSLAELVKSILKIAIITIVAWLTVRSEIASTLPLMAHEVGDIMIYISKVSFRILSMTCWVLVALAMMDYAYQKWEHERSLKMTKQEIRDENKQTEGDPLIKGRIRRLQRETARKRMMAAVPKADVVITNPQHLAVALSYAPEKMNAPIVVAKGADFLAAKIREIAADHHVPVIENKPVAQLLYRMVQVDHAIPEALYKAVAEILALVYSLRTNGNQNRS